VKSKAVLSLVLSVFVLFGGTGFAFADTEYVVVPGDWLSKIAIRYNTTYEELAAYNNIENPDLIFPGQIVRIPDAAPAPEPAPSEPAPAPEPAPSEPAPKPEPAPAGDAARCADFLAAVDTKYGYDIAVELSENPKFHSSPIGTRTAGSDAEHAAADWLAEQMQKIGLSDVEKVGAKVDKWQFNDAKIQLEGDSESIQLHSYATAATPAAGLTAEIVYVGEGTMWDYEGLDVKGKIVIADVDQRANWWVTYPMLEAEYQGAAAILAVPVSGFSEISADAYNANDICGPTSIPCVSITVNDANRIKERLESGPVRATLKVDNIVEPNGVSYNVTGRIPGKNRDEIILIGAHYDMYFHGFQDDSIAVGMMMSIAKAMLDAGYTPERDIVFVAHGAEEWGASYTVFDWTTGAWRMINEAHPEWAGRTLAFLNFELPAYEFADYTSVCSAPEFYSLIDRFVNEETSPKPVNAFPEGIKTEGYQTYTYSDDFSYYAAGVPAFINGFLLQEDMETVFPFYEQYYHTNFDTKEIYDEDVARFNTEFYGALAIRVDRTPALELDFTAQYDRLLAAMDEDLAEASGADAEGYAEAVLAYGEAAGELNARIKELNARCEESLASGAGDLEALWAEARALNKKTLAIFKETQDLLLGLMYERPIVPHEAPQENIALMNAIVSLLAEGEVQTAADEYAWKVNNIDEWYNMYFSPEVMDIFEDMMYGADNADNLFWGTGKAYVPADVESATRALMERYEDSGGDFGDEIAVYEAAIAAQRAVYVEIVNKEIASVVKLTGEMEAAAAR
jgi:Iap family predicted aminopeptidase/LysM repeat protein